MNRIELNIYLKIFLLLVIVLANYPVHAQQEIPVGFRTVPDSVKTAFRNDRDYAYANDPSYWKKDRPSKNTNFIENLFRVLQSPFIKWIIYILLLTIFIFVAYRILHVLGVFDRSIGGTKKLTVNPELSGTSEKDLSLMLENALMNGDLRLATRFHYLHLLKILSERKLIQLHAKSTNRDYIKQVNGSSFAPAFITLTRIYEHVWYGEAQISNEQFNFIDQSFKEIKSGLQP